MATVEAMAQSRHQIAQAQFRLAAMGFDSGAADGVWGARSREALNAFLVARNVGLAPTLNSETMALLNVEYDSLKKGRSIHETAHYSTMEAENYRVFPIKELVCRIAFGSEKVGLKKLEKIKRHLADSRCGDIWYKSKRYYLADMIERGVRLDLDGDGVRDLIVFLYGFQPNAPLSVVAFKMTYDPKDFKSLSPSERISPIERMFAPEEVFAIGEYPVVQNARFLSVADFNDDGKMDIFISDGGYDAKPNLKYYPSQVFLSSPEGFRVELLTKRSKIHGSAAGDVNGDGFVDIILGRTRVGNSGNAPHGTPQLFLNVGGASFVEAPAFLPESIMVKNERQPIFVELLDVDGDGFQDLILGMSCGLKSKIHWNNGKGEFTDEYATVIPLDYPKSASGCKERQNFSTIDQVFLVDESSTKKRYLGVLASRRWKERALGLHQIKRRELSKSVVKVPHEDLQGIDQSFAWQIEIEKRNSGHALNIFDYSFRRTRLLFDARDERYSVDMKNHEQNFRWKYSIDDVLQTGQ